MKCFLFVLCLNLCALTLFAQKEDYRNPMKTPIERADDLLSRLTLKEKIGLMKDTSYPVGRLGIAPYNWWNEALHGVGRAGLATVFPQAIGMAASFDDSAVLDVFSAVSDEARAKFHDFRRRRQFGRYQGLTFWTPNVNIFRDPRWGRGQETYGEDPYLTGRMGVAVVCGLQGPREAKYNKLHACAKHFAVHSGPEWNRHTFNVEKISNRDLWETYLPAFKDLVQEAKVKEVMCAYNRFEGEPCCSSKRLQVQILRNDWGYEDVIVSDCGAISDFFHVDRHGTHKGPADASADAVISGTDVECGNNYTSLEEAVKEGLITEEQIDISVRRLLKARFELGEMDPDSIVSWAKIPLSVVNCKKHQELALDMARKTMTLLQNNGILPLSKSGLNIAVMGPNANDSVMQWGNYNGVPGHTITILEGIYSKIGYVPYEKGCDLVTNNSFESLFNLITTVDGQPGFSARYWNNKEMKGEVVTTQIVSTPFKFDIGGATVFASGVNLTDFSAQYKGIFRPDRSGTVILSISGDDGYRIRVNGEEVINYWGTHAGAKKEYALIAEVGKEYDIEIDYMQDRGGAYLQFDIGNYHEITPDVAVEKVKDADVVIFVGGISPKLEGEEMKVDLPGFRGGDRTDIELPIVQRKLLKALKDAGKKVIFVNCSGSAIALGPETKVCDAILQAWYPGQAGGLAVADVLFGDYNPAGRLPVTFYTGVEQLPDFEDYSMRGRTYRYMTEKPLFSFGHGLSYTTFRYGVAKVNKNVIESNETSILDIPLFNAGNRKGEEVIQVYIRFLEDKEAPLKTLRAFRRVSLEAGERQDIRFFLSPASFEFFDSDTNTMRVRPGTYELLYGGTSSDEDLQKIQLMIK